MHGYFFRSYKLVVLRLVCFYLPLAAFPSVGFASAFSPVSGATIVSPASPSVSVVDTSYRFAANDPRVTFVGGASDYPRPQGVVAKTYPRSAWAPKALPALRASGASFALFFAADAVCQAVDCVNLIWGQPMTTLGDGPAVTTNYSAFPNYFGTESAVVVGSASSIGWNALTESDRNQIQSWLNATVFGTRPIATVLAFRAVLVNASSNLYQQQFRVLYTYTDTPTPLQCPDPYVVSGARCVASAGGETIPFDESMFANAVPSPTLDPDAAQLNLALWRELDSDSVTGDIFIDFEPVTESLTQQFSNADGNFVRETTSVYEYPVINNNSPSPTVQPTKSVTENLYQNGNLIESDTVVETPSGEGGVPPSPLADCDFFPTLCDFIDWFTVYDEPEEVDFSGLVRDDFESVDYEFIAPSGSCPPPLNISLGFFGASVDFSYDLICELAEYLRYFVLIAAYLISAQLVVRSVK